MRMSRPTFLISGSLAYDRILDFPGRFVDHLVPGKLHRLSVSFLVNGLKENFGGTAGNIAYSLSLLGERTNLLPAAGKDFGPYRRWLLRHRVNVSAIRIRAELPTSSAYIITDREDNQIAGFNPGAMETSGAALRSGWRGDRYFGVVSAGNPKDMSRYSREFNRRHIPFLFDPAQQIPRLSRTALNAVRQAALFISNEYELALTLNKLRASLNTLLRRKVTVITTLGRKGSIIRHLGKIHSIPAAKPRSELDPTGAGDAYRAGFLSAYVRGWPMPVCGRLGSVAAVYTVERYGTQTHHFTWKDIRRRYARNFHHSLPTTP